MQYIYISFDYTDEISEMTAKLKYKLNMHNLRDQVMDFYIYI